MHASLFIIDSPIHYPSIQPSTCLIIHSSMHLSLPSRIHYPLTCPSIHLLIPPTTHPSNHSSTHPATHHSSIHLSIILLPYPQSTYPPSTDLFIFFYFFGSLFILIFIHFPNTHSSTHHPSTSCTHSAIHTSIHLLNYLPIYLSIHLPICQLRHYPPIHNPSLIHP